MDVFQTHARILSAYATYVWSFLIIADERIDAVLEHELERGRLRS